MPAAPANQATPDLSGGSLNLQPQSQQFTNTKYATPTTPDGLKSMILAKAPNGIASDGTKYSAMPARTLAFKVSQKYPTGVTADGRNYKDFLTPTGFSSDLVPAATTAIGQMIEQAQKGAMKVNEGINQAMQPGQAAGNLPIGLAKAGAGAIEGTIGALAAPVMQPVGSAIGSLINSFSDKVADYPSVQKVANSSAAPFIEKGAQTVQDLSTIGGALVGGLKPTAVGSEVKSATTGFATKLGEAKTAVKESVTGNKEEVFNKNLNKALPILKKDVKSLPQKQAAAKTAIGDIVANKDSHGLLDSSGNPRNPANFAETVQAQTARLKNLYHDYTERLTTADSTKFQEGVGTTLKAKVDSITNQLENKNLTIDNQRALTKIKTEIGGLKDTSPKGIQDYIEQINQKTRVAPGHPMTPEQVQYANLGGDLRKMLDENVEKIDGTGYQDLRSTYGAHKQLESQLLMAAKKEMNNVPGLTEKLTNLGVSVEGLNFMLTHDPHSLILAGGTKIGMKIWQHLKSPQTALGKLYKLAEQDAQTTSKSTSAQQITPTAKSSSNIIPDKVPSMASESKSRAMGTYTLRPNPLTGRAEIKGFRKPGVKPPEPKQQLLLGPGKEKPILMGSGKDKSSVTSVPAKKLRPVADPKTGRMKKVFSSEGK